MGAAGVVVRSRSGEKKEIPSFKNNPAIRPVSLGLLVDSLAG
jgi:hypothetical protein